MSPFLLFLISASRLPRLPVMFIFHAAVCETTHCELCTIKCQRCVAGVAAARRPQQTCTLSGSAACQGFGPFTPPLGFSWPVIGRLVEAVCLQVVGRSGCIKEILRFTSLAYCENKAKSLWSFSGPIFLIFFAHCRKFTKKYKAKINTFKVNARSSENLT